MKKNTAEGVIEKGAVDGIVGDKGGFGSDFRGGCNNGADEIGGGPENLTNIRLETKGG